MICIYKIKSPSGKVYIGQTIDWNRRFREYKQRLGKSQTKLYRSFLKYGYINHTFEVLIECEIEKLDFYECYYIDLYDSVNNGLNSKGGGSAGYMPMDLRKRISESHKGKIIKESTKEKLRFYKGKNHHMFGKTLPEHVKKKMSEKAKLRKHTPETKAKLSLIQIGGNSPMAKLVLDTNTGIYYDSPRDVANTFNFNLSTLRSWLNGGLKNKTQFIYY